MLVAGYALCIGTLGLVAGPLGRDRRGLRLPAREPPDRSWTRRPQARAAASAGLVLAAVWIALVTVVAAHWSPDRPGGLVAPSR